KWPPKMALKKWPSKNSPQTSGFCFFSVLWGKADFIVWQPNAILRVYLEVEYIQCFFVDLGH
ncbi:MAG: hypothetical protein ABW185_21445, partial [Sedimenticola sp.]